MRHILHFAFLLLVVTAYSQVGIGNEAPRGLLDVNDNPNGNATAGLVLPHADDVSSLENPNTDAASEIPGTVAFDKTSDCIRFIKNDNTWSECLAGSSSGGGGGNTGRSNISNLKTKLRFKQIDTEKGFDQYFLTIGITTDNEVYAWGRDTDGIIENNNKEKRSPVRIDGWTGTPKKVITGYRKLAILTEEGDLYVWGLNSSNVLVRTPTKIDVPSGGGSSWVYVVSGGGGSSASNQLFAITNTGKAYRNGAFAHSSIPATNGTWSELAFPPGVDNTTFRYTRAWGLNGSGSINIYLEGNDGNYYASGDNTYAQLGNRTSALSQTPLNPHTSSGIVKINLPSGKTVRTIRRFNGTGTVAIMTDGTAYWWGVADFQANPRVPKVFYARVVDENAPNATALGAYKVFTDPVQVTLPDGASMFYDICPMDRGRFLCNR